MWRTENNYNDDAVKPLVFAWKNFWNIVHCKRFFCETIDTFEGINKITQYYLRNIADRLEFFETIVFLPKKWVIPLDITNSNIKYVFSDHFLVLMVVYSVQLHIRIKTIKPFYQDYFWSSKSCSVRGVLVKDQR